jgi:hypothetical protein
VECRDNEEVLSHRKIDTQILMPTYAASDEACTQTE